MGRVTNTVIVSACLTTRCRLGTSLWLYTASAHCVPGMGLAASGGANMFQTWSPRPVIDKGHVCGKEDVPSCCLFIAWAAIRWGELLGPKGVGEPSLSARDKCSMKVDVEHLTCVLEATSFMTSSQMAFLGKLTKCEQKRLWSQTPKVRKMGYLL